MELNQPLRGRLYKAAARPQRRGERLGALKFKETEKYIGSIKEDWICYKYLGGIAERTMNGSLKH